MRELPFRLESVEDRKLVLAAIVEVCQFRGWRLIALHVRETHVHGVVQAENATPGRVMGDWKAYGSRRLKDCRTFRGDNLASVLRYVLEEQGEPMETYVASPRMSEGTAESSPS